jgi:hypothetical protein
MAEMLNKQAGNMSHNKYIIMYLELGYSEVDAKSASSYRLLFWRHFSHRFCQSTILVLKLPDQLTIHLYPTQREAFSLHRACLNS